MNKGQRFADFIASIIRSWFFVIGQAFFIGSWIFINLYFYNIAWDNKSFDMLKLILTAESSFIGSILLMNQHYRSEKDRKIIYSDYDLDVEINKELKEIRPMIDYIYRNLNK